MSIKRLQKEYQRIAKNNVILAHPRNGNMYLWDGVINGPINTPYEGGKFNVEIQIPKNYPFDPPKVFFKTKIYHPNISHKGDICISILKRCDGWVPSLTIEKVLLSISSLLDNPNPDDPLVPEIALLYKSNKKKYFAMAKKWTVNYASS